MAGTARRADFLHLHANVSRRVRNLETGVHPTAGEGYADVIGPINIPITGPFSNYAHGTAQAVSPKWQRRFGVVTLIGGVDPSPNWTALDAEETVGTLPVDARPLAEIMFNATMRSSPYVAGVRVQTNGVISVLNPPGATATVGVRFDGATWTID